jgi:hypothetical protein
MCASLTLEELEEFQSYSVIKSSFFIGRCPVNMKIVAHQTRAFYIGSKHKMAAFSKVIQTILIKFQLVEENISLNKIAQSVSSEKLRYAD